MPSLIESLSSSHIEAMFWGVPLITSKLPYTTDLCKEAAYYVANHTDPKAWKAAIIALYNDNNLCIHLIQKGYQESQKMPQTWDAAAYQISNEFSKIRIYESK